MAANATDWLTPVAVAQNLGIPATAVTSNLTIELEAYISAAVEYAQNYIGRPLLDVTRTLLHKPVVFRNAPLVITGVHDYIEGSPVELKYYGRDDRRRQTLKTYNSVSCAVDYDRENSRLVLVPTTEDGLWDQEVVEFYQVIFKAGMSPSEHPQVRTALQLIVNDLYNAVPMYSTSHLRTYDTSWHHSRGPRCWRNQRSSVKLGGVYS